MLVGILIAMLELQGPYGVEAKDRYYGIWTMESCLVEKVRQEQLTAGDTIHNGKPILAQRFSCVPTDAIGIKMEIENLR